MPFPSISTFFPYTTLFRSWWSVAVGLIIGGLSERSDLVEKIWMPISYMYMAVSGFFFLAAWLPPAVRGWALADRKSTRLNSSHVAISYAVFCLKKKMSIFY